MVAIEEHGVLRRLQPGPAIAEPAEGPAVEPGHFDHERATGPQHSSRRAQAAQRVVVVLEEVPHRDQIERPVRERRLVEETAVELDALERGARRQVLEVDAGDARAVLRAKPLEKRSRRAADVEHTP